MWFNPIKIKFQLKTNMKKQPEKNNNRALILLTILISLVLIVLTLLTQYYGSTDLGDYGDVAKYFAGNLASDIRSSHSYIYGFALSPFVGFFQNFMIFKIASLIFLFLIIYSVYYASNKNKKAFWLMLSSPIIWYMAPWINPIQLSALLFFWAYIFIKKFEKTEKIKHLIISGIFVGFSWMFWDAILFFALFLGITFLFNKKFYYLIYFTVAILIGLLPRLIFEQYFLGFAFSGVIRYLSGVLTASLYAGIYGTMAGYDILSKIVLLIITPFFTYKLFLKENWPNNKKTLIFLILAFLLIMKNSQIRYLLLLIPIITFELIPKLTFLQFKKQIIISSILLLIVIIPYEIQIGYSTNAEEFQTLLMNYNHIQIYENPNNLLLEDLTNLTKDYPNQTFVVGNQPDDFQRLSSIYWGKDVKEFVSMQDYNLYLTNETILLQKTLIPKPRINDRRQIFLSGGIAKNIWDNTDYKNIKYGIGLNEPLNISGFLLLKQYGSLYLYSRN